MKTNDLLLHCYFEKDGNQWLGFCLDFSLVSQGNSMEDAAKRLEAQMREYVFDATAGDDREHAGYLLRRRAPLGYWLKFYFTLFRQYRAHAVQASRRRKAVVGSLPLVPACA